MATVSKSKGENVNAKKANGKANKKGGNCPRCKWGTLQEVTGRLFCYSCKWPGAGASVATMEKIVALAKKFSTGKDTAATTNGLASQAEVTPATVRRTLRALGWHGFMAVVGTEEGDKRQQCWEAPKAKKPGIEGTSFQEPPKHLQKPDPSKSHPRTDGKSTEAAAQ